VTTPIASQLDDERQHTGPNGFDQQRKSYEAEDGNAAATHDFMVDLLDAQQDLITAQHQFLHGSDTTALLAAQNRFIVAQMNVLTRLGVYGAPS
jgi:hypothetical protein